MIPDFNLKFDGVEYEVVAYVEGQDCYDWDVEAILRRKSDGALFLASDSGCSCNCFGDTNPIQQQVYSIQEALRSYPPMIRSRMEQSLRTMTEVMTNGWLNA